MIRKITKNAIPHKRAKGILLILLILSILPFAILSFYSFPAIDDYSFAKMVMDHGFFGAQKTWYLTWTGRYFSSFALSLNPLLIGSNLLYQFINFLIILGTVHSLYFLFRKSALFGGRATSMILSLILSLAYLSHLPDLTQGFYWLPGSITYQLSIIASTYLLAFLFVESRPKTEGNASLRLACMMALIVVGCASNEIMMINVNFILLLFLIYSLFWLKRGAIRSVTLQVWSIIAGLIVVKAPGNKVRGGEDFSQFDFAVLNEQLTAAIESSESFLQNYLLIPVLPLLLVGSISTRQSKNTKPLNTVLLLLIIALFTLAVVFIAFFTSYLSVGLAPPARSQNICFWFLVIGSFFLGVVLARAGLFSTLHREFRYGVLGVSLFAILFLPYNTGFEYSIYDLFTGTAAKYKKQKETRLAMLTGGEGQVVLPALTAFPNSVYLTDLSADGDIWWNKLTAMHYDLEKVTVDYSNLEPALTYRLDYSDPNKYAMNIDTAMVLSQINLVEPSIYRQLPGQIYGPGVKLPFHNVWQAVKHKLSYIRVKGSARISDSNKPVHIVLVITGANDQTLLWREKKWDYDDGMHSENFIDNDFMLPIESLNQRAFNTISIFIWNPNGLSIDLMPLEISLY